MRWPRRGGVGWYPRSGFIHLDSGPVRNWDLDNDGLQDLLVAQEDTQFVHHPYDRAVGVAIGAIEGGTRMGVDEPQSEPPGRDRRRPYTGRWCAQ